MAKIKRKFTKETKGVSNLFKRERKFTKETRGVF